MIRFFYFEHVVLLGKYSYLLLGVLFFCIPEAIILQFIFEAVNTSRYRLPGLEKFNYVPGENIKIFRAVSSGDHGVLPIRSFLHLIYLY